MKTKYTKSDMKIARQLWDMMDDEGTLQASDMLRMTGEPTLHTTLQVERAFLALAGKEWDAEYMIDTLSE